VGRAVRPVPRRITVSPSRGPCRQASTRRGWPATPRSGLSPNPREPSATEPAVASRTSKPQQPWPRRRPPTPYRGGVGCWWWALRVTCQGAGQSGFRSALPSRAFGRSGAAEPRDAPCVARARQSIGTLRETASKYRLGTLPGTRPRLPPRRLSLGPRRRFPARDEVRPPIGHGTQAAADFGGVVGARGSLARLVAVRLLHAQGARDSVHDAHHLRQALR